jgi:uncharacterized protein YwqG
MTTWQPEKDVNALMDRFAKPCIRLHRPFPPRPQRGRSKLGGLPNLPDNVEWPHGHEHFGFKRGRIPLHFMAQIDCAELPRIDAALPASGMLFFFANIDDAADWMEHPADHYRRVVYVPHVAAGQPLRQPPPGLPVFGTASLAGRGYVGNPYPLGYGFGHQPDDPLTGKIYFEWPVEFVVADSYPRTDEIRQTQAFQDLARFAESSTAEERARGGNDWWDEGSLADYYNDASSDRAARSFWAALGVPSPPRDYPQRAPKIWRQVDKTMQGAFPPTAAFIAEIATAIDNALRDKALEQQRSPSPGMPSPTDDGRMFDQLAGRIRGIFGLRQSPPLQPALAPPGPDWLEDVEIVRQEAAQWQKFSRALPADHPIDAETRERFLAWLDAFEDNGFTRIAGHKPEVGDIHYIFNAAMFQLARLSASQPSIRAHFPDQLYTMHFAFSGSHHQMLGHFPCSQEIERHGVHMVPLLSLSYDTVPDFRICDVGELQFFIEQRDLASRDFARVEAQMQGG